MLVDTTQRIEVLTIVSSSSFLQQQARQASAARLPRVDVHHSLLGVPPPAKQ
jgi:hypothetical protein